ncbi:Rrf2 family transcriptional regulator [Pelagicoccus sp. SDUM812005]|uniref:RrF2 family transcriptional regulator n=1 Tax=Pelagicoccus sp. SDUM812005 TaxID=3041257 RepID=UPI00280D1E4B|nr:Rrf2 family transcriptional regulator [Pelagicoccus sp. SDUM812005]MDQ8183406.1 Rrf2 family transcriptional regulator [Pelagicoccus sp. SDUM812005]
MKLSVKLDYACRALARMAVRLPSGDLSRIEELAEVEAIPANYLVQILGELRNGGLIESRRGKQGGYLLARPPEEISLREVISLVQGDVFGSVANAAGASGESVARAWKSLQDCFEAKASELTVKDLMPSSPDEMYYI